MSDVTVSFGIGIPVEKHTDLIEALRTIFAGLPSLMGPFTVKIVDNEGWNIVAEVAWRGEIFVKFMPAQRPNGQDGKIVCSKWSAGGSPSGEWLFSPCSVNGAGLCLKSALQEHAERVLEKHTPQVKNAGAALAMLALAGELRR